MTKISVLNIKGEKVNDITLNVLSSLLIPAKNPV